MEFFIYFYPLAKTPWPSNSSFIFRRAMTSFVHVLDLRGFCEEKMKCESGSPVAFIRMQSKACKYNDVKLTSSKSFYR